MALQLTVPNMACSACSDTITQAVKEIDPTAKVHADPKTKQVTIDAKASDTDVQQAIKTAGYQIENVNAIVPEHPAEQRAAEDLNQDL